jgi:hypothetical protein
MKAFAVTPGCRQVCMTILLDDAEAYNGNISSLFAIIACGVFVQKYLGTATVAFSFLNITPSNV